MNSNTRLYLLLAFLGLQLLAAAGCANTAKGISQDYHRAEDKVEQAVK